MRYFLKPRTLVASAIAVVLAITVYAETPSWVQWLPATSPALNALYRMVPAPGGGSIPVRRPPKETTPELAALSSRNPSDATLITLTAREYEAQLDFTNAEARWKMLDAASSDRAAGPIALADYYHRRMQPQQELQALSTAQSRLPAIENPLQPPAEQRAWKLHDRVQQLIQAEAMPAAAATQDYEAWITKYPAVASLQVRYFDFLIANNLLTRASQLMDSYQRAFPNDRVFPIRARTALAEKRGAPGGAIAIYDGAFDPLWPPELLDGYFKLLVDSRKLFDFYQSAARAAVARPLDLAPAARLFHYYRKQSDPAAARRALSEFRLRKEASKATWTAAELNSLAKLFDSVNDYEETIRYAYALYSLPGVDRAAQESALVQIISVLLKAPDQPIRFGKGDLSFYHDIATIDSSPGFLNGILSLIFNSQYPDSQFRTQESRGVAYFHRAKTAELYELLSKNFPSSVRRSELLSQLIESYAQYGEDDAIIRKGNAFITDFPDAPQRTKVALQIADAYARRRQVADELGVYNRLLNELAVKAQRIPLGSGQPRSPEYAQVLQRYVSRLTQLNRIADALALYRAEIDHNPDDPGLYDRLADFLGANQRAGQIAQVYRDAMQRFPDPSWRHKLARYYLRYRMTNDLRTLSQEVVNSFSGSEVEGYFADVIADGGLERRLQLEINLYAHNRFPHDLRFVHNLIGLYSGGVTADPAALLRLLGENWYEDESIRRMYFERLAAGSGLQRVVQTAAGLLPSNSLGSWPDAVAVNPAVTRFIAEAAAWQSHFESASTIMRAVAAAYPADSLFAGRASELYRSLAAYDGNNTAVAVSIAEDLSRSEPRDRERLVRIGEIYADRELMTPATTVWTRIPLIEPGKPDGYLETATLFWDYLRPADALSSLRKGRTQLKEPALWSYEAGAILESQNNRQEAVTEYIQGALRAKNSASQARLLRLATRQDYKALVDEQTRLRVESSPEDPDALQLRVNVLRAQQRQSELQPLLAQVVDRTSSREILTYVRGVATEVGMRSIQERVSRREIQLESDPEQQLRLRIGLVHFLEDGGDLTAAQALIETIYQANPLISGVIRATADYYWRHDKPRAVRVLMTASERAHASLKGDYLAETVRKAIEAQQFNEARQAAENLLRIDPINGQYIALMADTLSASGEQTQLQQLYVSKIAEIQQAQISPADKTDRVALMRRGLIPVLVRENKFREALDQYIEIINRFPDDEIILSEAARLAAQRNLQTQLVAYYTRTVETSSRDPRWAIVLARIQTQYENYPAAIDAYTRAMAARPERQDLAVARGDLEERTSRFADAIVTFNRVYELSHKNPIWLERIARLEGRLGRTAEAVATLRRGYIDNRPEVSREYQRVAVILEELGMIDAAADIIRQQPLNGPTGVPLPAAVYARIMTRARKSDEALQRVFDARDGGAANEMGIAVATYFTPEERQALATRLADRRQAATPEQLEMLINVADRGRFYDLEVRWLIEQTVPDMANGRRGFVDLQQRRMRFSELAKQTEDLAARLQPNQRLGLLMTAMQSYQAIGDTTAELQLMTAHAELQVNQRQRYYELLARARPDELVSIAGRGANDNSSLLAAQTLIDAGDQARALQAIQAQRRNPVWADAYTGLAGEYFGLNTPAVTGAFQRILGPPVVADRLGKPVNRTSQLAGDIWFYYGQRYGEFLRDGGQVAAAEDYLYSEVESRPGDSQAYLELARYYGQTKETQRAITEFGHTLELDTRRADVYSELALTLLDDGRQNEALAEWKAGLEKVEAQPNPTMAERIIRDIRLRRQETALHTEIDRALRSAARTLQVWQLPALLQVAFENSSDDQWLLDVMNSSRSPNQLFTSLTGVGSSAAWLSPRQKKLVFQNAISALSTAPEANRFEYMQLRQRYLDFLLDENPHPALRADLSQREREAEAKRVLDSMNEQERRTAGAQQAQIRLASLQNTLVALLTNWSKSPAEAPPEYILQETAVALERQGLADASRQVLEFLYSRQIETSNNPAAFLGLAEIRVKQGQLIQAVELLRRLNRISAAPFEHLLASGRVLSGNGQPVEAEEFFRLRVQAVPWDGEARLELAKVLLASNRQRDVAAQNLQTIVSSSVTPYDIRTAAAQEEGSARLTGGSTGSRELDVLSNRTPMTPASADAPYFFTARTAAAEQSTDANVRVRLLLAAIAERPDDAPTRRSLFRAALAARQYRLVLAAVRRGDAPDVETTTGVAEAHQQLGEFSAAAVSYGRAALLEKDTTRKDALLTRQREAQAATDRALENERRRPMIRADVDQPNVVRRRIP